ncbi:TPM domain-containing protein [Streptomyces sp. NPDC004609]|uniref:TPM domain-containing protein n=1 Tax=Streptomyces sp. NPDC004609 TaxID=3364704 RepID=UPI00367C844D
MAAWWPVTPPAPAASSAPAVSTVSGASAASSTPAISGALGAPADGPVALARDGQITDRVDALGDRGPEGVRSLDRLYDGERLQLFVVCVRDFPGRPVPTPAVTPGDPDPGAAPARTGAADLVLPVALVVGAGLAAAYARTKRRRRAATRSTPRGGQTGWGGGDLPGPPPPSLSELGTRAGQALVDTDDALLTSQEELGFATARFGEEATKPFAEAVGDARNELTAAFRLRRQLDDAHPEDDTVRRRTLEEILARCADADRRLDAEAEDFDRLRALERDAPQALATAQSAFDELNGRMITTEATLSVMHARYAPSAAAPVAGNAEEAKNRLDFAKTALDRSRTAIEAADDGAAAVGIRAAEGALAQADLLIDAVDRRARELAEAAGGLPGALTETDSDLAEAHGTLRGTPATEPTAGLQGRIARAEAVAAEVRREMEAGPYDPIDALRRVEEADAALGEALTGTRDGREAARRVRALLDRATLGARSAVGAAADYITTRRGAVASAARTRLAEARWLLARSGEAADSGDAQGALAEAQRADGLARQAQDLAEEDVRAFGNPFGPGGVQEAGRAGGGLGSAVLGGIILGGLFDGGRGGSHGGGFGGGSPGGGFGDGAFGGGPGRFGGGGTRGRMGAGRF